MQVAKKLSNKEAFLWRKQAWILLQPRLGILYFLPLAHRWIALVSYFILWL